MNRIYIAIPYTSMEEESFKQANKIAARLMKSGNIVFSPISHSHMIAKQNELPGDWHFWACQDREFIKWCDTVLVIQMDGWKDSLGVKRELEIAKEYKKEIKYLMPVG